MNGKLLQIHLQHLVCMSVKLLISYGIVWNRRGVALYWGPGDPVPGAHSECGGGGGGAAIATGKVTLCTR